MLCYAGSILRFPSVFLLPVCLFNWPWPLFFVLLIWYDRASPCRWSPWEICSPVQSPLAEEISQQLSSWTVNWMITVQMCSPKGRHQYSLGCRNGMPGARLLCSASVPGCSARHQEAVGKPLNCFLLLYLNTKTKTKAVKPDTKTNTNLRNIDNFGNEPIRAELCRTRSAYEN
jgi:hypothetical protein